jgi:hypothetical protein
VIEEPALATPAEFARIKGADRSTVSRAMKDRIKRAIVTRNGKRMIDVELAMSLWDKNTTPNNNAKISQKKQAPAQQVVARQPADPAAAALLNTVLTTPDDEIPDRYDSESRKVHYQAELAKLQTLKERGELVPVADVRQEASRIARQVRDLLLNIPTRNAAKVATMQDQEEVRALLQNEIEMALRGLANESA